MTDEFRIGVVIKPHGLKGEVKVYPTTDSPRRFDDVKKCSLRAASGRAPVPGGAEAQVKVTRAAYFKNTVILKFEGIDDADAAAKLTGAEIYIPRDEGIELNEGEYYIADLIGIKVVSDEGKTLGVLRDVLQTGANDVYVVERENMKDLLVPAIKQCILDVDLDNAVMKVHLLPGLWDL